MQFHALFEVNNNYQQHTKFQEKIVIFQVHGWKDGKAQLASLNATNMLSNILSPQVCMALSGLPFCTFFQHLDI